MIDFASDQTMHQPSASIQVPALYLYPLNDSFVPRHTYPSPSPASLTEMTPTHFLHQALTRPPLVLVVRVCHNKASLALVAWARVCANQEKAASPFNIFSTAFKESSKKLARPAPSFTHFRAPLATSTRLSLVTLCVFHYAHCSTRNLSVADPTCSIRKPSLPTHSSSPLSYCAMSLLCQRTTLSRLPRLL
jgi:hypothetical protein